MLGFSEVPVKRCASLKIIFRLLFRICNITKLYFFISCCCMRHCVNDLLIYKVAICRNPASAEYTYTWYTMLICYTIYGIFGIVCSIYYMLYTHVYVVHMFGRCSICYCICYLWYIPCVAYSISTSTMHSPSQPPTNLHLVGLALRLKEFTREFVELPTSLL